MIEPAPSHFSRYGPRLFLGLAVMLLALLGISLWRGSAQGINREDLPFVAIAILETAGPAFLCILAAGQARRGGKRWLVIAALVVCAPLVLGFCIAPFLMLGAGTLKNYWLFGGLLLFVLVEVTIYLVLVACTVQDHLHHSHGARN